MFPFSKRSLKNLGECHWILQEVASEATKSFNFIVIKGFRNKKDQNFAYRQGLSKLKFPYSGHNKRPSLAFDSVPCPLNWKDTDSFNRMGAIMKKSAETIFFKYGIKGVVFQWGGDYKTWKDRPHFEIKLSDDFILCYQPEKYKNETN